MKTPGSRMQDLQTAAIETWNKNSDPCFEPTLDSSPPKAYESLKRCCYEVQPGSCDNTQGLAREADEAEASMDKIMLIDSYLGVGQADVISSL